jgi:anti-sigma regulatory factor (Ser/Thr protein kinase)
VATRTPAPRGRRLRPGGPEQRGTVDEQHVLHRPLPGTPAAARLARVAVRVAVRAWRLPDVEERAALVVSEAVTAALRHTAGGGLLLVVATTRRRLRTEVRSTGGLPVTLAADSRDDADAAAVLDATATRWGTCDAGRTVWAELALQA